jgi:hypothetical protein
MIVRLIRAVLLVVALGAAANYFHTHHEEVETLQFRVIAATILLGLVFVLCALKAAMISLSPQYLMAEIANGNEMAKVVIRFRKNASHFILVVGFMITLSTLMLGDLTEAAMPSLGAKVAMALVIALVAEVIADYVGIKYKLKLAFILSPMTQLLFDLMIFVQPVSWLITKVLGHEEDGALREGMLTYMLEQEMLKGGGDLAPVEIKLALNAIMTDHLPMKEVSNVVSPGSMLEWSRFEARLPVLPERGTEAYQQLLSRLKETCELHRWLVFVDEKQEPQSVLDVRRFGAELGFKGDDAAPIYHFVQPATVVDGDVELGQALMLFELESRAPEANIVKQDVLLVRASDGLRIFTASDYFGDLVMGVARVRGELPRAV